MDLPPFVTLCMAARNPAEQHDGQSQNLETDVHCRGRTGRLLAANALVEKSIDMYI